MPDDIFVRLEYWLRAGISGSAAQGGGKRKSVMNGIAQPAIKTCLMPREAAIAAKTVRNAGKD